MGSLAKMSDRLPASKLLVDSSRRPASRALATLALALLFGLAASEAHAGLAFVKNIGTATGSSSGGTSITITLAAGVSVAAGNSIIVSFVGPDLSGTYGATDSAGNSYGVNASGARAGTVRTVVLSAHNVNALASGNTITVTFPSTSNRRAVTADEFSGLAKTGTFDQSHTGNGSSTAPDSGFTATTAQPAELLLGAIGVAGAASDTFTAGNDGHGGTCTALPRVNSGGNIFSVNPEYEIVAATNTYKATATITSASWAADIATYKADANCGNGTVDAGEDCDQGASNGTAGSCCSASCRFVTSGTVCRAAANECDVTESCTGSSATCPADTVKAAGTACTDDGNPCTTDLCDGTSVTCTHPAGNAGAVCRAAAGECDTAETCDGSSTACPPDAFKASGTACTADANPCTLDQCNGTSATCTHPAGNTGTVCRAAAGPCDVAETCTGTSTTCPADALRSSSTVCRAAVDLCDAAENCTGTSATCPADAIKAAGTVCRAAAGECDLAETCDGVTTACPTDAKKSAGTSCTADTNPCTLEQCDGGSATCPHPAGNAGTVCRAAAGPCDAAETCTGTSTTCPANAFLPSSTVCRAAVDLCDAAENCTGSSATCPANAVKSAGAVCRAAAGECDVAETCDGVGTSCPTDVAKASGTACTADTNPCTTDVCNGTSATCTHPAGNAGAACPDDGDPCTTDTCDGTSTTCMHPPGNAGAVCRAAANGCDVVETCPGAIVIGFRGATSASSGSNSSATSLSISRPPGTLANDVMVASITAHDGPSVPTITTPAGWTLIVNTNQSGQRNFAVSTYWKVAGTLAADPGPYIFTVTSSSVAGGISAYFNVDTISPINAALGAQGSSTPSLTTTVSNTMLVACFGRDDSVAIGAPAGMTERFHAETSNGSSDAASESADASRAAVGATGPKTSTNARISQLIALAPASSSCPTDTVKAAGTSCTDDGNVCTTDLCNGTVGAPAAVHTAGNAGAVCRASAGPCDVAETCTGTSTTCPADAFQPSSTVCRAAVNECDSAETCTGTSASCPADTVRAAGTACTNDGNPCTTDSCNGTVGSPACVHDAGNAGAVCRAAAGQCDVAETCDGAHTTCPADGFKAAGTSCGSSASSDCDQPDTCNGSATCQPNHVADGTSCTDEGNVCTADVCSTGVCTHPAGHAGTVCRASAGVCDPAETCTGISTTCPVDAKSAAGTDCRAAAGVCDMAETCDGSSDACPSDAFKSSSTVCRAAAGECDP